MYNAVDQLEDYSTLNKMQLSTQFVLWFGIVSISLMSGVFSGFKSIFRPTYELNSISVYLPESAVNTPLSRKRRLMMKRSREDSSSNEEPLHSEVLSSLLMLSHHLRGWCHFTCITWVIGHCCILWALGSINISLEVNEHWSWSPFTVVFFSSPRNQFFHLIVTHRHMQPKHTWLAMLTAQ